VFGLFELPWLLLGLIHAQTFTIWPGAWASWAWVVQLLTAGLLFKGIHQAATPWCAFKRMGLFGWGQVSAVWWIFISLHRYGDVPAWLAVGVVLLGVGVLSLYGAGAAAGYRWLRGNLQTNKVDQWILWGACCVLAELAKGTWFTGFPWLSWGYAHVDGPLAAFLPWVGVYGTSFIVALCSAALGHSWRVWFTGAGMLCAIAASLSMNLWRVTDLLPQEPALSPAVPLLRVALLQGNIDQGEKFNPQTGLPQAIHWYGHIWREKRSVDLVITPETVLPILPRDLPPEVWADWLGHWREAPHATLLGTPWGDWRSGYFNSVLGFVPGFHQKESVYSYRYDKHHLLPFGEFVPTGFAWFFHWLHIPLGSFERGVMLAPSFDWKGEHWAPLICVEDLFGEELALRFRQPEQAPTVLVNLSNLAWFGDTVALEQHLLISRVRALEFARPFLRVTNTGVTALIDAQGRVTARLPTNQAGVLEGTVQGGRLLTPYARWASHAGLWPLWGMMGGLVLLGTCWRWRFYARRLKKALSVLK
jgi:apolipoprotein N-acyltransferase